MLGISRSDIARNYCEVSIDSDTHRVILTGLTREHDGATMTPRQRRGIKDAPSDALVRVLTTLDQQTVELRIETNIPTASGTRKQGE